MSSKRGIPPRTNLSVDNLIIRGVPHSYVEASLSNYNQSSSKKKTVKRYLEHLHDMYEDRICLTLYGSNGSGKTYLSSIIVKEAYRLRYNSAITTVANLLDLTFKSNKTEQDLYKLKMYKEADFLVLDEVGKENFTRTGSNINLLEETLRSAITRGQVIILCTNLPLEGKGGLYEQYGASIKSLIDSSITLEFDEEDYRPEALQKKRALNLLLGE